MSFSINVISTISCEHETIERTSEQQKITLICFNLNVISQHTNSSPQISNIDFEEAIDPQDHTAWFVSLGLFFSFSRASSARETSNYFDNYLHSKFHTLISISNQFLIMLGSSTQSSMYWSNEKNFCALLEKIKIFPASPFVFNTFFFFGSHASGDSPEK